MWYCNYNDNEDSVNTKYNVWLIVEQNNTEKKHQSYSAEFIYSYIIIWIIYKSAIYIYIYIFTAMLKLLFIIEKRVNEENSPNCPHGTRLDFHSVAMTDVSFHL